MPLQTLGLNTIPPYPRLEEVINLSKLEDRVKEGLIHRCQHPDAKTTLFCYTPKCVKENAWDEITAKVTGWVVRDGLLIGRSPCKAWELNTPGMPETRKEGFPKENPSISIMEDGIQGTMFPGLRGMEFAQKDCFVSGATLWAGNYYRTHHKKASWADGWCPVFQIVGPKFGKGSWYEYIRENLVLMALVDIRTGDEGTLEDVIGWANFNDMSHVGEWKNGVEKAVEGDWAFKGLVMNWRLVKNPPIKVKILKPGDDRERILSNTTPELIWELCRDGAELGPLVDVRLPWEFTQWVRGWELKIRGEKLGAETDALEIFSQISGQIAEIPVKDVRVRRTLIAKMHEIAREKDQLRLMPILISMIDDEPTAERYAWEIARRGGIGQKGWRK